MIPGALVLAAALGLAIASGGAYQRVGPEWVRYEGVAPGWDSTRVVVGGWPLPYLLDRMSVSPVGSVDFVGALVGVDTFRPGRFLADVAFYLAVLWGAWQGARAVLRRRRREAG